MKPGGGKSKGSAFERLVCKRLSLFISKGKKEDVFWRSAMSGGRATLAAKKGKGTAAKAQAGDISAVSIEGYELANTYYIECKSYADLDLVPFFLGKQTGNLALFWQQTIDAAREHGKEPMLIAKQNKLDPLLLMLSPNLNLIPKKRPAALLLLLRRYPMTIVYSFNEYFPLPLKRRGKGRET